MQTYIVVYRNNKSEHSTNELVVHGSQELFSICWLFSNSEDIIEYKVVCTSGVIEPKFIMEIFGWGNMPKWVGKFDWSKIE